MGLRLVDDGSSSGDGSAALADARQSVAGARARLQALAERLAELRRRLGEGDPGQARPQQGDPFEPGVPFPSPRSGD